ncbi:hypothetical protein ADIAL_1991 [Alkalibacterium sp. AK22]|uniref:DUF2254 domain-containing protein n=1 Tax=Alkalibacterium sp. AK22 TaxID=1229520 RepID=UPI00044895EF|nr:DUF2254 domain-containing protein [Alkalibacterium sp. AK22]EXJ22405.1 hypothetical protein ADIAL_1991 [Alkalibacterium sp. AK22]
MLEKLNLNMEETKIWLTLGGSVLFSFLLSIVVIVLDTRVFDVVNDLPRWSVTSVSLAREILSLLAGSLFSVATFTFATMLTIITLYTSNFSPRAMENFLMNPVSMRTLGVFLGGFIYCLSSLFFMRSTEEELLVISATVALFYALGSVFMFTRFVYSSAQYVQLEKLIHNLYVEAEDVYDRFIERFEPYQTLKHLPELDFLYAYTVSASQSAYIEHIQFDPLKKTAEEHDLLIQLSFRVGQFITKGESVAEILTNKKIKDIDTVFNQVNQSFSYEEKKSALFDPGYARVKLTEVALRAVSPGINDPNTAIHILRYKALLERKLAALPGKYAMIKDDEKKLDSADSNTYQGVVFYRYNDFAQDLYRGYWQLVFYMQQDIAGVHALFEALKTIAFKSHGDNLGFIKEYNDYLYKMTIKNFEEDFDQQVIERGYTDVTAILEQNKNQIKESK